MIDRWGGENFLKTCLRGYERIVHSFWGGLKNFLWNDSKLYISLGGIKNIFIFHIRGIKMNFPSSERGFKIFVMSIWIWPPHYWWVINDQPLKEFGFQSWINFSRHSLFLNLWLDLSKLQKIGTTISNFKLQISNSNFQYNFQLMYTSLSKQFFTR